LPQRTGFRTAIP